MPAAVPLTGDVVLVVLLAVDLLLTPDPRRLVVERRLPPRVGLAQPFDRVLRVGGSGRALVRVHEEFPAACEVLSRSLDGALAPPAGGPEGRDPSGGPDRGRAREGELVLLRRYRARRRGVLHFGALRVATRGPLGLVWKQARRSAADELMVLPALEGLSRTLALAASERWRDLGVRLLRRAGGETEFESLRHYVSGDDVRRVDWKAFAKRGEPIVRSYQVERGQELFLLVDRGRRMRLLTEDDRSRGWTKLDWALDAALQVAAVALGRGDRVGCAAFARGLDAFVSPARGPRQLERLIRALFALHAEPVEAQLARALQELAIRHRRRATVVVLSDVADPLSVGRQRRALAAAARHHRVVFCALDDPGLRAALEETTEPTLRAAATELVGDRERALRSLRTTGVRVLDPLPAEAAGPLLTAWLSVRGA